MGDADRVVEGYVQLANLLVKSWADLGTRVAAHLSTGSVTPAEFAADFAASSTLAMQSAVLIASEALDAAAILRGTQHQPLTTKPQKFTAPANPAVAPADRPLRLAGPLMYDLGGDSLLFVTIDPKTLAPGKTEFTVAADGTGHRAGCYRGFVDVLDLAGGVTESVPVFVLV